MSAVIPEGRQKRVTSAQKVSSLEQHAAELSEQLKQLQLENHRLRRRERVLAAVSSATQQAVNMIQQLGSAIQGIAAPVSQPQSLSIAKIDACIGITLRDLECSTLGAAPMSSGPLRWPTDANTPLAQQLAGGGPLALMQHSLGLLQRYHQYLGWVQRQTPETSRDMLYLIQGGAHGDKFACSMSSHPPTPFCGFRTMPLHTADHACTHAVDRLSALSTVSASGVLADCACSAQLVSPAM
jgi:hypothetical protein